MKKLITLLLSLLLTTFGNLAFAAHYIIMPEQPIVLFYDISDIVIDSQFSKGDKNKCRTSFEKMLTKEYSKRFNLQDVRPVPQSGMTLEEYRKILKEDQLPLILTLTSLQKQTVSGHYYATYDATLGRATAFCFKVELTESFPDLDENRFIDWEYLPYEYYANPITFGGIQRGYESERHSIKTSVKEAIHAACEQDIRAGYTPSAD